MAHTTETAARTDRREPLANPTALAIVVLTGVQPFAAFLTANASRIVRPALVVVTAGVWTLLLLGIFLLVRVRTRRLPPTVVAIPFAIGVASFGLYGSWLPAEPESAAIRLVALVIWLVVTVGCVVVGLRLARLPSAGTFALTMMALWVVVTMVQFAAIRSTLDGGDTPETYAGADIGTFESTPNVYWFIFDEHARSDQLLRWSGEDNSWFGDDLAARGFSVSESSTSAYLMTHLSIPSTLAMTYPYVPGHEYVGEHVRAAQIFADNPVRDAFEANGYQVIFALDGSVEWASCPSPEDGRACTPSEGGLLALREPFTPLLRMTPLGPSAWQSRYNDVGGVLAGIDAARADGPVFVIAHILSPHFPQRYEADCSIRDTWVSGRNLSGEARAALYANDVRCLDGEIVDAVDRLLASDPEAVIIVQSDHGSRLEYNAGTVFEKTSTDALVERFAALNAIRLPAGCRDRSIEGEPLVNTFRLVLACLAGQQPELLEPRTFFTEFASLDSLVEVPNGGAEP